MNKSYIDHGDCNSLKDALSELSKVTKIVKSGEFKLSIEGEQLSSSMVISKSMDDIRITPEIIETLMSLFERLDGYYKSCMEEESNE